MVSPRRKFQRPLGERRYKKVFVIAVEGAVTEPQYFDLFSSQQSVIHVECLKGNSASSPPQVLARMESRIHERGLAPSDEAWLVVDKDRWTEDQLLQLHRWTLARKGRGLALSNPKFEYWLLLHFEDGSGIRSSQECSDRLARTTAVCGKSIIPRQFTLERIQEAVQNAKQRDQPPCTDWPRTMGTTVYRLVEAMLKAAFP